MYDLSMSLRKFLSGVIPDNKLAMVSDRYEVIGDVAIVTIPPGMEAYREDIAIALLSQRRNIRVVLRKTEKTAGDDRVAAYEVLIGDGTITEHREFGYRYQLDVARVFFNSRLATERMRVANQIIPRERVLIPFCGIGPFVVPVAAKGASVAAIEKNPEAFSWLSRNLELNHVSDRVSSFCNDAFHIPDLVKPGFDRVISPTPYGLDSILDLLSGMTRPGGIIHFYTFKSGNEIESLKETYRKKSLIATACQQCGFIAPGISRYVFDLKKE
jgi:tRNA (guanine37-N1)-methyltransferase